MIVIENGAIVQSGTPAEVTAKPRSQYVADLAGVNLLRGTAAGTTVKLDGGGQLITASSSSGPVLAVIQPSAVSVQREQPQSADANTWPGSRSEERRVGKEGRSRR